MSRKGNRWDNAVNESFFSSLKKERIKKQIPSHRDLLQLLRAMRRRLDADMSLDALATRAGWSPFRLHRAFTFYLTGRPAFLESCALVAWIVAISLCSVSSFRKRSTGGGPFGSSCSTVSANSRRFPENRP